MAPLDVRYRYRDPLTTYIDFARVLVARDRRIHRELSMIEIKGLGESIKQARKAIVDAREESAGVGADTRALVTTLKEVRVQVNAAHEDLKFEASTLGNSPPSDPQSEKPAPPQDGERPLEPVA